MPPHWRETFLHQENLANLKSHLSFATDDAQRRTLEQLLAEELKKEDVRLNALK